MANADEKQKIRQRYKGIALDEIEKIPAIEEKDIFDDDSYKRVGVYARVSTDDPRQTSSFELQRNHYTDLIDRRPGWHLHRIYADEGISGTSLKHRDAFLEMIEDCRQHKIDLIVTKSVSRFARNIYDCIGYVRMLADLKPPVGVLFETENIYTLKEGSEMALSFIATLAQEESHTKSSSMNLSYEMRFSRGIFMTPELLGYDKNEDGELVINEDEALTVRLIFFMFLYGYTGEMNQEAFFKFSDYVSSSIPPVKLLRNMQIAADYLAKKGFGMIHSVSGVGYTMDLDVDMEHWFAKGLDNGLQMRVYFQTMDVQKAKRRKLIRIGGCFDAALDGCFGSADAAMLEPYEGTDDKGVLYYDQEKVNEFCKKVNREGMQIEIHAIGDAAFQQATRALKAALDDYPRKDHRHTIIHACLPTEEGIQICKDYEIALAIQSAFIDWPNEPNEYLEGLLGERAAKLNPFKTYADNGIIQALGSDGPCTDPNPMLWIHKACNNGAESLTVQQALKMATYNGYWMSFDEKERGSLEVGKSADMVILSENPLTADTSALEQIKVELVFLGGKSYKKVSQAPIGQILKGLLTK